MKKILSLGLVVLLIVASWTCIGCNEASDYTEEEHIQRVSELVEKRYFSKDSSYINDFEYGLEYDVDFESYEINPIYDINDKLAYFVVDFYPTGYIYIKINKKDSSYLWGTSMYTRTQLKKWARYTVKEHDSEIAAKEDFIWETDEHGNKIYYTDSHYKEAKIENEKRYLLEITQAGRSNFIPAIKKEHGYLNLVSMEEFLYEPEVDKEVYAIADINFIPKPEMNL